MTNIIILVIVAVIILAGLKSSVKHFKGEGACCGGGSGDLPAEKKKLEGPVLGKKVVHISGMHCEHCVNAVTNAINELDGASAKVSLRGKKAVVSYDKEIADSAIKKAVEDAGYQVVSIES